jgi:hypothetical protein
MTAARELTEDAIDTLAAIMKDPKAPAGARILAAQALLDRGHGKPPLAVDVKYETWDLTRLTTEELETLERIMRQAIFPPPILPATLEERDQITQQDLSYLQAIDQSAGWRRS